MILYRPVGLQELVLIYDSGRRAREYSVTAEEKK
jgi:hypothetical protein